MVRLFENIPYACCGYGFLNNKLSSVGVVDTEDGWGRGGESEVFQYLFYSKLTSVWRPTLIYVLLNFYFFNSTTFLLLVKM